MQQPNNNSGEWNEWRNFVLNELKQLSESYKDILSEIREQRRDDNNCMTAMKSDYMTRFIETNTSIGRTISKIWAEIAVLKTKSGIWGAVGGVVSAMLIIIVGVIVGLVRIR